MAGAAGAVRAVGGRLEVFGGRVSTLSVGALVAARGGDCLPVVVGGTEFLVCSINVSC